MIPVRYRLIILFIFFRQIVSAQSDSAQYAASLNNAVNFYFTSLAQDAAIYNGTQYLGHDAKVKSSPFFLSDSMQRGNIFYAGNLYTNIPLLYDMVSQVVVINRIGAENLKMQLLNEKLKYFTAGDHKFLRLKDSKDSLSEIKFYDVLYEGRADALAFRSKYLTSSLSKEEAGAYKESVIYFIRKNDQNYKVTSKNDIINVLFDKKENIRSFLHKNNLNFRKEPEATLNSVVAYYSTL